MEEYKLFICDKYEPLGGYYDFSGSFENISLAKEYVNLNFKDLFYEKAHIVFNDKIIEVSEKENQCDEWTWKDN